MNGNAAWRVPAWRSLVWVGVVASVVAWTWAWFLGQGAAVFMVVVALAGVALAYRATAGLRIAIVGLMVAGFVMFLASVYWMFWVLMPAGSTSAFDLVTASVFPMVSAAILLLGSVAGYRHTHDTAAEAAPDAATS